MGSVVCGIHHNGVVRDAKLVENIEELADMAVVLDHGVVVEALPGEAQRLLLDPDPEMHPGRVPPHEERRA